MSREKILIVGDSLKSPTGFSVNGTNLSWALAKEYEVHYLGLQSNANREIELSLFNDKRIVFEHPNFPRTGERWDFGKRSLPYLLDRIKPDILLTINDIQMIEHIPGILYPQNINIKMMDLPSKRMVSRDALIMELDARIQEFKEKYPLDFKWVLYGPQDGEPPMPFWGEIYSLADQVVAFCKYGQSIYKQFFGLDVPYIYHGIDTDAFSPKPRTQFKRKFVIGNMNRNQPRKQPIRTMQAFMKFAKGKQDVLLHMQMDWNDQFGWPIHYFAQMYGIMDKMIPPAQVGIPQEEIINIYNCWDLNVNTTGGEGFGITEIEGMSCGKPNICTDYTSTKELTLFGKPSPRGTMIPVKELYWEKLDTAAVQRSAADVDALADIFEMYYRNRDLLEEHGENAREWAVNNVCMKTIQNQWLSLIKEVLNNEK